jgi:hypothetical protein
MQLLMYCSESNLRIRCSNPTRRAACTELRISIHTTLYVSNDVLKLDLNSVTLLHGGKANVGLCVSIRRSTGSMYCDFRMQEATKASS